MPTEKLRFKDLSIGDVFWFAIEEDKYLSMARGPWRKISARKYIRHDPDRPSYFSELTPIKVGWINVEVERED
jgi:hypothetical protein